MGWIGAAVFRLLAFLSFSGFAFPIFDLIIFFLFLLNIVLATEHWGREWVVFFAIGMNWGMNFSIFLIPVGLNVGVAGVTPL